LRVGQVNCGRLCHSRGDFAILAPVQILFYILVVAQIAVGLYSLWDGFAWFQMVRRRLASHAGFYTPATALICPCKGNERGLEENLLALTRFDYPNYEIYFTLATSLDPALKVIERVKAASQRTVHIVIAGPPTDCGEKVYNLQRAVEALPPDKFEMLAFTDSDVRLPRTWLTKLIAPLNDGRIGATTAYRWIIPSGSGMEALASCFASAWNGAIATMLGKPNGNFCWGGGTAIRRKTSCRHAAPMDRGRAVGVHQSPDSDHAHLFAEKVAIWSRRALELFVDAALCGVRNPLQHGGRRPLGSAPAAHSCDSVAGGNEGRDAHNRCERSNAGIKSEAAGVELGVPCARAVGAIFIFVEFYYVAFDQKHPLARYSLRVGDAQHDAHSQTLGLGAVSARGANAR
jgi:hypothetical protein